MHRPSVTSPALVPGARRSAQLGYSAAAYGGYSPHAYADANGFAAARARSLRRSDLDGALSRFVRVAVCTCAWPPGRPAGRDFAPVVGRAGRRQRSVTLDARETAQWRARGRARRVAEEPPAVSTREKL